MTTITLRIDESTKLGKGLLDFLKVLSEESDYVEIVEIIKTEK
jgi:hypothetical protein